jgi:two-component system cell cycle response regulator DivK
MPENVKILYVEDNPENRMLVRRILMAEDFDVLEAGDAYQAMKLVETVQPDLILMDINLPEIDGYTLTARLKENPKLSQVPIIALTANVMKGDRERILDSGCDGYIQKPIDVDALPFQIRSFLGDVDRGQ